VDEIGNTIVVDQDSISVDEVKLLADKINLQLADGQILQTSIDALVMTYRSQFDGQDENILSANIGFENINRFQGMQLFINPPLNSDDIQDSDFFGDSTNYAFIMRGTYNSKDFEYLSNISFDKSFDFGNIIELNNKEETLLIRILLNMRSILVDGTQNAILDPGDPDNQVTIDSLLKEDISIEAFAGDVF